jgi:hypothetical protein
LAPLTRDLLLVGSVFGRTVELGPLAVLAGVDPDVAVESLEEALGARLLEETAPGAYRYAHALVGSALYESLSASRRARLHQRAATFYEGRPGEEASLAHHLVAALPLSSRSEAARACRAAGDRALFVLADAEATGWYHKGLDALSDSDDDAGLAIDLRTGLGEAQRRTSDPSFRATLMDAAQRAADRHDRDRLVRAVLANNRGLTSVTGEVDEERLRWIGAALDAVGPAPSRERADLLSLLGAELAFAYDHQGRLAAADEAAAIAVEIGDLALRARVGTRRLMACLVPDRVLDLANECAETIRLVDTTADPLLQVLARVLSVGPTDLAGRLHEARRMCAEALAMADETGQPSLRAYARFFYAGTIDAFGQHAEAVRLTEAALELGQQASQPDAIQWYAGRMWLHWSFEGQPDVAAATAAQGYAAHPLLGAWECARAFSLRLGSRDDELADVMTRLPDVLSNLVVNMLWLPAYFLASMALRLGRQDAAVARMIYERLLPYGGLHAGLQIAYLGPIELALGACARAFGDREAAIAHHEAAAATIQQCGATRAWALNGYHWGLALLEQGAPEATKLAVELLHDSRRQCQEHGYATLLQNVQQALETAK